MVDNLIHAVKRHLVKSPIPLREIQLPSAGATGHSSEHGLLRDDDDRRRDGDDTMHDGDDNRRDVSSGVRDLPVCLFVSLRLTQTSCLQSQ